MRLKHPEGTCYATSGSVCFDFIANIEKPITLSTKTYLTIPTGCFIESVENNEVLQVMSRSGLASIHCIFVANVPEIIDKDFTDEIKVMLINFGPDFIINPGNRIAQGMVVNILLVENILVKQTTRVGGLGSTGGTN